MYLIYDKDGNITSIDSHQPGPIFNWIFLDSVPEDVQLQYKVEDEQLVMRTQPFSHPYNYAISRIGEYDISIQLELLSNDINDGLFGDSAKTGSFMNYINEIKSKFPKE
jgi:hypothetical protein